MKALLASIGDYVKRLDKPLFLLCLGLSVLSVTLLYSLYANNVTDTIKVRDIQMQVISLCLGTLAALVLAVLDYQKLAKLWFIYYPIVFLLVMALFLFGTGVDGADDLNWIQVGPVSVQPSELLKIAFILGFAYHLSKVADHINALPTFFLLCAHGAAPVLLITIQGDYGTALVFLVIFVVMMFSAGISWKYIAAALVAAPIAVLFLWNFVLQDLHKKRILAVFDSSYDPTGTTLYQQNQAKIALGSGQIFGKGLFGGDYSWVPVVQNDFIFSYVGQVFGFVGCLLVVGVFCTICLKILYDSRTAKDDLGKNICVGAFALIFIHCFMNIGMVLGVMPVIGIPLPFLSAGGTAMLGMFVVIGLVLSTHFHSNRSNALFYGD